MASNAKSFTKESWPRSSTANPPGISVGSLCELAISLEPLCVPHVEVDFIFGLLDSPQPYQFSDFPHAILHGAHRVRVVDPIAQRFLGAHVIIALVLKSLIRVLHSATGHFADDGRQILDLQIFRGEVVDSTN